MQWHTIKSGGLFFLLLIILFAGCERITIDPDNTRSGYDYYPLSQGDYRVYDVYRISYNFATENDTLQFEVKEVISKKYLNQEGDTTFVLERYNRQQQESPWKFDSAYHIRRTIYQAIELNNNRPLVKLVFPVQEGKTWNSNQLNNMEADSFKMTDVHKPFRIDGQQYPGTVTVLHRNIQDTIVRQDVRKEIFAPGIGPVYRLVKSLTYCATPDCVGKGIVNTGLFEEMKIKDYGKD